MRWDWVALIAVAAVLLSALVLREPNADLLRYEVDGSVAYLDGFTDGRSQGVVRDLVRDHPEVTTLVLRDMPGTRDVTSNYRLGRTIRQAGLNTRLTADSRIASGAVDLFLAGVARTAACGAMVGVHAWGSDGFDARDTGWDTHRAYSRDYLSEMGIDPDFYDFRTEAAGSESIHWMSVEEVNRWRVVTNPMRCEQA